jgi:hypothetical protein
LKVIEVVEENGQLVVKGNYQKLEVEKPKGFIHWLSDADAVNCEVRNYSVLFKCKDPNKVESYIE